MSYGRSAYLTHTNTLLASGRDVLATVGKPAGAAKIAELERAADPSADASFAFSATAGQGGANAEDALRSILYEAQSANVLIAAGIATEIPQPSTMPLSQALDQIEEVQGTATTAVAGFLFASGSSAKSADLASAKQTFRADAQFSLDRCVSESVEVISSVFDQLKKMDGSEVAAAIEKLGKPFEQAVQAGRLLKKGIEKLKTVIQHLLDLLGGGAMETVKKQVSDVWTRLTNGEYAKDLLASSFGVKHTMSRIDAILASASVDISDLDSASNAFRPLTDNFGSKMSLMKGILATIVVITGGITLLHLAVPWLPLIVAGAYVALIGATVLIGMNYAGSGGVLQWVKGVREIADNLAPASSASA